MKILRIRTWCFRRAVDHLNVKIFDRSFLPEHGVWVNRKITVDESEGMLRVVWPSVCEPCWNYKKRNKRKRKCGTENWNRKRKDILGSSKEKKVGGKKCIGCTLQLYPSNKREFRTCVKYPRNILKTSCIFFGGDLCKPMT